MLQISAFTRGTFVSSLDVQSAVFEAEARGSALWLDVYRPRDNEVMLFNRFLHEVPPKENSFVFSLGSFDQMKRLVICRTDPKKGTQSLLADATVLYADDLVVSIRHRGFHFHELCDFISQNNDGKMPADPTILYELFPPTLLNMFEKDLHGSDDVMFLSEKGEGYEEDIAYFEQLNWTLREITIPVDALLKERDSESVTISIAATGTGSSKLSGSTSSFASSSAILSKEDLRTSESSRVRAQRAASTEAAKTGKLQPRAPKVPRLLMKRGPEVGKEYPLDKTPIRLGREVSNDIVLIANGVSRKHAIITRDGKKVLITDLGSTNGTYVNTRRIQQAHLKDGDEIYLGNTILKFAT
ncbi:MAG: FHA domain-containing protein [Planctomycetota bacterium]|nr:FHA domain-containing protein [Planctomycetota bacterium]